MAPSVLRDLSPSSFNPRVVSIGPLHKLDANVQEFEKHKATYMIKLMSRINSSEDEILESCMQKVFASMKSIKASYVWTTPYDDVAIAKMMVLDACFILEFIHRLSKSESLFNGNLSLSESVIDDLVLLENQIPFFFLHEIFECTLLKFKPNTSLIQLFHPVLHDTRLFEFKAEVYLNNHNISIDTTHHILSLLHQCYKPSQDNIASQDFLTNRFHSAVDLDRAGVNFKPNQNPTCLMEMKVELNSFTYFCGSWCKPTLRMPILNVGDETEPLLRNLIAYEQSFPTSKHISSYVTAMDMLVNTGEDVDKLVESGVLDNNMGSNEDVANMINNINKQVLCEEFFYKQEWNVLTNYYNGYWPKNIAWLRSTYFNSPWNMIALLAGIVLFVLTVVQTIFTIKPPGNE